MTRKEARATLEAMIIERQETIRRACMVGPGDLEWAALTLARAKAAREITALTTSMPSLLTPLAT